MTLHPTCVECSFVVLEQLTWARGTVLSLDVVQSHLNEVWSAECRLREPSSVGTPPRILQELGEGNVAVLWELPTNANVLTVGLGPALDSGSRRRILCATGLQSADWTGVDAPRPWRAFLFLRINSHVLLFGRTQLRLALGAEVAARATASGVRWRVLQDLGGYDLVVDVAAGSVRDVGRIIASLEAMTIESLAESLSADHPLHQVAQERPGGHVFSAREMILTRPRGAKTESPEDKARPAMVSLRYFPGHGREVADFVRNALREPSPSVSIDTTHGRFNAVVRGLTLAQAEALGTELVTENHNANAVGKLPPVERTVTQLLLGDAEKIESPPEHSRAEHPEPATLSQLRATRDALLHTCRTAKERDFISAVSQLQLEQTFAAVIRAVRDYDHRPLVADLARFAITWGRQVDMTLRQWTRDPKSSAVPNWQDVAALESNTARGCQILGGCLSARLDPPFGSHAARTSDLDSAALKAIALVSYAVEEAARCIARYTHKDVELLVTVGQKHQHNSESLGPGCIVVHLTPLVVFQPGLAAVYAVHELGHASNVVLDRVSVPFSNPPGALEADRGSAVLDTSTPIDAVGRTASFMAARWECWQAYLRGVEDHFFQDIMEQAGLYPSDAAIAAETYREANGPYADPFTAVVDASTRRDRAHWPLASWLAARVKSDREDRERLIEHLLFGLAPSTKPARAAQLREAWNAFDGDLEHLIVEWQTAKLVEHRAYLQYVASQIRNVGVRPGSRQTMAICMLVAERCFQLDVDSLLMERKADGVAALFHRMREIYAPMLTWLSSDLQSLERFDARDVVERAFDTCATSLAEVLFEAWQRSLSPLMDVTRTVETEVASA